MIPAGRLGLAPVGGHAQIWRFARPTSATIRLLLLAALSQLALLGAFLLARRPDAVMLAQAVLLAVAAGAGIAVTLLRRETRATATALDDALRQVAAARDASIAAQAANESKSRYLSHVSHEIRSPLNAIYGYAQLVEQDAGVNPRDAARIIRRCAEHMTGLIESLLDISQLENGVLRVESAPVRLGAFIDQVVSMMTPAATAKGLRLCVELPANLPDVVRMDESRLRQVLVNLLSNAIKFTREGSVTLKLGYRGQIATLQVIDTGPGIAPDNLERIFMPFDRADALAEPGVGLGLPISRAIVEIMGGELTVASETGKGSCFTVKLMLAEVAGARAQERPQPGAQRFEGPCRSILVVDDDPDQRAFIDHYLSGCGFEVVAVQDGRTALTLASARSFDLALLDISMPGLSGWTLASRLRARFGNAIRLVMLSANCGESGVAPGDEPVHDHFLAKPVRLDMLATTIGTLLDLRWIVAPDAADDPPQAERASVALLPPQAQVHVQRLRELLRIGYARGVEAELHALARLLPAESVLMRDLYDSLDRFDMAAMRRLLAEV